MDIPSIDLLAIETRRGKRELLLGENPACFRCGHTNIDSLLLVSRSFLELHHVVGRANDGELTAPLCRNCHAELTEAYRDAGVPPNRPPTFLHRLAAILRALGALFSDLGKKLSAWAETLIQFIQRLDTELPSWRGIDKPDA
jgi:hypothetical protein